MVLYEAANVMLTRPVKGSALKRWGLAVAKRAGMRKAKVALARKLAVVLHKMMRSGQAFRAFSLWLESLWGFRNGRVM